jgi:hypothetical protein
MAATPSGWPLPEQTTGPPDVVKWLTDGLTAADTQVNGRILYGPTASCPANLPAGVVYLGF